MDSTALCIIGKFPPLIGGTSAQALWLTHRLAEAGNDVHVVGTGRVPSASQLQFHRPNEWLYASDQFPSLSRVKVHDLESSSGSYSIPTTNALVTRLSGEAVRVINEGHCRAVIGIYLEPFGVAAQVAATATGVPLYLMHAGSDITRLSTSIARRSVYGAALAQADRILTSPTAAQTVLELGADPASMIVGRPLFAPRSLFKATMPLDLRDLATDLDGSSDYRYIGPTATSSPVVLVYGKLGEFKGTTELIAAAERLQNQGLDFCLLFVTGQSGPWFEGLLRDVENRNLTERFIAVPYLPPWRVPEILARASVVAFLENRFPITIHRPQIPREAMSAGKCVILTKDVAEYQRTTEPLIDRENVLLVSDPREIDQLAEALVAALDPDIGGAIAEKSRSVYSLPSDDTGKRWIDRLIGAVHVDYQEKETRRMAIDGFNRALVRLYSDREYRLTMRRNGEIPEVAREQLTQHEGRSLIELSMDEEALERYCRSILTKKYHFLSRPFEVLFAQYSELGDSSRSRFLEQWVLDDAGLPSDFGRFKALVLSCLDSNGPDGEQAGLIRDQVLLVGTRSEVLYSEPTPDSDAADFAPAGLLGLTAPHRFLRLSRHPHLTSVRPWYVLIERDARSFRTNILELTLSTAALFEALTQGPIPVAEAIDLMIDVSNAPEDEVRSAAERAILDYHDRGLVTSRPRT